MHQARFHSRRIEDAEDALSDACVEFLRFYDGSSGEDVVRWMLLVVKRCAWAITRRTEIRSARRGVVDIAQVGDDDLQTIAFEGQFEMDPDQGTAVRLREASAFARFSKRGKSSAHVRQFLTRRL